MHNKIIFLMGVSGSGKTTVRNALLEQRDDLVYVQSCSTRPMRPGESQGNPYRFLSDKAFTAGIENNEFLEYAIVHEKYYYGTRKKDIQSVLDKGKNPIKEIDMYGLEIIKEKTEITGQYVTLFMDIPNETMKERIIKRDPHTPTEEIDRRIASTEHERSQAFALCDHIINANQPLTDVIQAVDTTINNILISDNDTDD